MQDVIRLHGGALVFPDGAVAFRQVADWFKVSAHPLGPSQIELTAKRPTYYVEGTEDDLTNDQKAQLRAIRSGVAPEPTEAEIEARRALSLRVAANRAKTRVRKFCKVIRADSLLTLTYRVNMQDLQRCKRHLREFVRRLRRVCPNFRAVATFERQKRGAWHVHLATPRLVLVAGEGVKSYNLIRAIWRSVTGEDGGNIDVSRRYRAGRMSAAKIAAYISKYIVKAFEEGESESNRWTRFGEMEIPPALDLGVIRCAREMIESLYQLLDPGFEVATAIYSRFGDWFYLAAESPHDVLSIP